jgi:hypothetical protein
MQARNHKLRLYLAEKEMVASMTVHPKCPLQ